MFNTKGYCVKCNRGKKKGEGVFIELHNETSEIIQTKKGQKRMIRGNCSVCGSKVVMMCGK